MSDNVMLFSNGNTAFFRNGEQLPEAQVSWLLLYAKHLESIGINPTQCELDMPNGRKAKIFKIEDGYNWEFI